MYGIVGKIPRIKVIFDRRHQAKKNGYGYVDIRITYNGEQKYISTGVKLHPKEWKNGTIMYRLDAQQLNLSIDKWVTDIRKVLLEMQEEGIIDIFAIPERIERMRQGEMTFLEFAHQREKVRKYGKALDSQQRYERFFKVLEEWGKIVYFEDVNDDNIIAFDKYLAAKGMKNYSKWQNYHRFLNSFILDSIDAGLLKRNPYKWVRIEKDKDGKALEKMLTPEELEIIKNAQLPTPALMQIRDLFVFQCYTCLAYADLKAFNPKNIELVKGKKVYLGQRKKGHRVYGDFTIPMMEPALEILTKYRNKLPKVESQYYNRMLKVLAQACGIDKPITSHWARHTGATLLLNNGVPLGIVSKVLGHSSTKMTEQVYAKLLDETVVDEISKFEENQKKE